MSGNDPYDFTQQPKTTADIAGEILPTERAAADTTGYNPERNGSVAYGGGRYESGPSIHRFQPGQTSIVETFAGRFLLQCSDTGEMVIFRLAK